MKGKGYRVKIKKSLSYNIRPCTGPAGRDRNQMRFLQIAESLTACRELQLLGTSLGPELEDQINEAMAWHYLEEELVDESGSDPSQDGARPVDPVIVPGAEDQGRPEGPGGVHAGAREGDGEQVAGGDGETDGQGSRALHTLGVVTVGSRGEHD